MAEVMSIETKIQLTEKALGSARDDKNKAEAQKGVLETELNTQYAKSRAFGVEPEQLGEEISKIRAEVASLFTQVTELIPPEYLQRVGL
jgi:SMC interacting uncharacterized protein involved in chromosome segregation